MSPTEAMRVTAGQLAVFAGNVNDSRVITEARELCERHGADPDVVAEIRYRPAETRTPAQLVFVTYLLNDDGQRYLVDGQGALWDPMQTAVGAMPVVATTSKTVKLTGELPTWWDQAARTVPPSFAPVDPEA